MSQNVSTNPKDSEPLTTPSSIQPWSAEAEADKLMDELFSDIDRILDGSNRLPTEPAKPEYVSLKPIVIPQLAAPGAVKPIPSTVKQSQEELLEQPSAELTESKPSESLVETEVAAKSSSPREKSGWSFDRLLLLLGFVVLGASLILLFVSKKKLTLPSWLQPPISPSGQKSQVSAGDAQFAQYMLRSLNNIEAKAKAQQAAVPPGGGAGTPNSSPMPSGNNRIPAASAPQRVIERVYIPVYPPQSPVAPTRPSAGVRPLVPNLSAPAANPSVSSSAVRRLVVSPSPAVKRSAPTSSPAAKRSAPSPSPVAKRSAPASPKASAPADLPIELPALPSVPPAVMVPNAPVTQLPASGGKHTLVGVMEQGDRSAALFNMDGVTRYVYIGEAIGNSGWTLVSVANQEAVIRRNGEVRSVYAGQAF
jgi:hypothetical protein